jgi:hypothetical protein
MEGSRKRGQGSSWTAAPEEEIASTNQRPCAFRNHCLQALKIMMSTLNVVLWFRMVPRKWVNVLDKYDIYSQPVIFIYMY